MRHDKLTTKFQEALGDAQTLALGNDNAYIEPAHLLVAMLRQDDGPKALLQRAGVNVPGLLAAAEAAIKRLPEVQGQEQVQVGPELAKLLQATEKESIKRGDQFIASELFLLALADSKAEIGNMARANGLTRKSLEAAIDAVRGGQSVDSADAEGQREALKKYTIDLTERARMGKLDPVIGRDDEIRRAIQVLQRRTKNNPVLIGEPGVGKTAIVGRPGAAHRGRRGARFAQGQARAEPGHGRAAGRRQVPRRVRGAPEERAQGAGQGRRPDHRLHRRAAHHGGRRQGRRRHGRRQHAQARAGARRAALRGRDHAGRIPQVHREGRRAGAPLPEDPGGRADGGGDHRHPARPEGALRGAPRRGDHRPGHRGRGRAEPPLHHRPLPARQGDRPDRRGRVQDQDRARLQARGHGQARPPADPAADRARSREEAKRTRPRKSASS